MAPLPSPLDQLLFKIKEILGNYTARCYEICRVMIFHSLSHPPCRACASWKGRYAGWTACPGAWTMP